MDNRLLWNRPVIRISVNMTSESYKILIGTIRAVLAEVQGSADLLNRPRLPQQLLGQPPPSWIVLELIGRGDQRTEIALRSDNLYMVGFKNNAGDWYEFRPGTGARVITNSIELNFGGGYTDLLGKGGRKNLGNYDLSKATLLDAIGTLYNNPSPYISETDLKAAIATIIVMVIEASRINPIRNRIFNSWPMGTRLDNTISKYTVTWAKMSFYILCMSNGRPWTNSGANELATMGINTIDSALDNVNIVLWPVNFDQNHVEMSCKRSCNNS